MSYRATAALQAAVYQVLRDDAALRELVGDAIYDAMPVSVPAGVHVALGPEEARDAGDMTGAGAVHDLTVSVLSGADETGGFATVKAAAAAVCDALESAGMTIGCGHLAGLWFLRARARRTEKGAGRRVDLTFRARIDLG
ncbi:DUF3168 domain-containing protein [Paracoccus kondratievae]|uniref:DUF3168 domain-containing protein n=1 Tax=Paracoccus kondratievae TaxID=135740 RepID=A0AAD3NWU2_9RHOB|nr:DUF3168 domain-containing protein [Paracoccus kondratievae]GLK63218.1 hypothetical protein GCM10017635_06880 [Paracoccus kondratievae]